MTARHRRGPRAGAGSAEWIIGVTIVLIVGLTFVTLFGRSVARRFAAAASSLDQGSPQNASVLAGTPGGPSDPDTHFRMGAGGKTYATIDPDQPVGPTPDKTRIEDPDHWDPYSWDAKSILEKMTQIDQSLPVGDKGTMDDRLRCAQAVALAQRIMAGPAAVALMLDDMLKHADSDPTFFSNYSPGPPPMIGYLTVEVFKKTIATLQERLNHGRLDHGDLGMMMELLHEGFGSHDPKALGTGDDGIGKMNQLGYGKDANGNPLGPPANPGEGNNTYKDVKADELKKDLDNLPPGASMTVSIDTMKPPGMDHAILMGKDASGRTYIYDPYPYAPDASGHTPPQIRYLDEHPEVFDQYKKTMPPDGFRENSPVKFPSL